ncbi:LPXTG cell wall anchor domain-containing protein [Olsenella uli]|uniref:SpaA isopeptide-forming pilin-related protein n=1 Tax=Olsenella uli TaxID=133926 RepID=UPI00195C01B9|nr:SpaA isopeptide-forming pilin-related protein [Olsenella uli]MBM6676279.1 LPXTG cell wall anchor domain-containing protein [Olsenella uli]
MRLKERLRGVVAAVAAAALALSVAPVTALAAGTPLQKGNATVTGVNGAGTIELYKVASVFIGEDNELDYELEPGFDFDIQDYMDDPEVVANQIAKQLGDQEPTYSKSAGFSTTANFWDIDAGLYLVKATSEKAGVSWQTTILSCVPRAQDPSSGNWGKPSGTVELKKNDDTVNSSLTVQVSDDGETWTDSVDTLDRGDTVYVKVTVDLPTYNGLTKDSGINFVLYNSLPEGLSFVDDSDSRTVNGEKVGMLTNNKQSDGTFQTRVSLSSSDLMKVEAGDQLVLTLEATVDGGQVGTLTDETYVEWYRHVTDDDPTTTTATEKTEADVVLYGANVTKVVGTEQDGAVVGSADAEKLSGASFRLEKWNEDTQAWETTYGGGSIAANKGADKATTADQLSLGAGTYRWTETVAPDGYQLNETPLEFVLGDGENEAKNVEASYFGDLPKTPLSSLPSTGGIGAVALTAAGAGLVAGAAYLVARARKDS